MTEYREEDYLNIAGLQHFAFCRRQWALIHIEQQWKENLRTIEGDILHEKAHDGNMCEKRGSIIISRGMAVFSCTFGVSGVCDVVEFHKSNDGIALKDREGLYSPIPIEYKRGSPKSGDCDALQLCAQAICLEEMLACDIPIGYMYYGETNHRQRIELTNELREKVQSMLKEMHEYYSRRFTPKVRISKSCKACSLVDICIPKLTKGLSSSKYINDNISKCLREEQT